jgi:hypothetical protein
VEQQSPLLAWRARVLESARGRADLAGDRRAGRKRDRARHGMLLAALAVSMVLSALGEWLNLPKL